MLLYAVLVQPEPGRLLSLIVMVRGGRTISRVLFPNGWSRERNMSLAIRGRVISHLSSRGVMLFSLSEPTPWPVHPMAYSATPSPQRHGITPRSTGHW